LYVGPLDSDNFEYRKRDYLSRNAEIKLWFVTEVCRLAQIPDNNNKFGSSNNKKE